MQDYYTASATTALIDATTNNVFGQSTVEYQVRRRRVVRNLGHSLGYLVLLKQRIIIPNTPGPLIGPSGANSYQYPAILTSKVTLTVNNGAAVTIRGLFPRTLNSAVTASQSTDVTGATTTNEEHTSGSSNTNVNSFGVSVGGGSFGPIPIGSLTLDYSHSWDDEANQSDSHGGAKTDESGTSDGLTMSIKDWSVYGYLDDQAVSPEWIWAQSYPWDVLQYNQSSSGNTINLPQFIQQRMLSGTMVLPPSQLALFGLDFSMRAGWLLDYPDGVSEDETLTVQHIVAEYSASHSVSNGLLSATLQSGQSAMMMEYNSEELNLSAYALDPIDGVSSGNGAAIGFTAHPFVYPPAPPAPSPFKIISPANNLQVTGTGFDPAPSTEVQTPLTTSFAQGPVSVSATFKIADSTVEYALLLMHWIGANGGPVKLTCTINNFWTAVLYVDSVEGQGGQGNMSVLELRNTDFSSLNLHDYLVVGYNEVDIQLDPVDPSAANSYSLFALAVGQA